MILLGINNQEEIPEEEQHTFVTSATIIIFLQIGFSLFEISFVQKKNWTNILMKNMVDFQFCVLGFWMLGFGFSTGKGNAFCGTENFIGMDMVAAKFGPWFYELVFPTTSSTLISGAWIGRVKLNFYAFFSLVYGSWIYPILAHWEFSTNGWLSRLNTGGTRVTIGVHDTAGAGSVHLLSSVIALIGTVVLGPRVGKFPTTNTTTTTAAGTNAVYREHRSALYLILGFLFILIAWIPFNAGSNETIRNNQNYSAVPYSTVLTIAGSTVSGIIISFIKHRDYIYHPEIIIMSSLSGAITSSASAAYVIKGWASFIIGFVSSFPSYYCGILLKKLKIDDPVGVSPMHGVSSIWGLIATGLFASKTSITPHNGLFFGGGFGILKSNLLLIIVTIGWGIVNGFIFIWCLNKIWNISVPYDEQIAGLDATEHNCKIEGFIVSENDQNFEESSWDTNNSENNDSEKNRSEINGSEINDSEINGSENNYL
ncbi:ammonium transporter [Anaeramoeba flamelloides]|uniref:Ammonium transporter n=1 Tax=Anaeramoeba flamelloides TaxID=1746091 RepID=A0ABQ8YK32_9EUKA|nr:ammonium transporter [Anaeramoeba flamelloides]